LEGRRGGECKRARALNRVPAAGGADGVRRNTSGLGRKNIPSAPGGSKNKHGLSFGVEKAEAGSLAQFLGVPDHKVTGERIAVDKLEGGRLSKDTEAERTKTRTLGS